VKSLFLAMALVAFLFLGCKPPQVVVPVAVQLPGVDADWVNSLIEAANNEMEGYVVFELSPSLRGVHGQSVILVPGTFLSTHRDDSDRVFVTVPEGSSYLEIKDLLVDEFNN